MNNSLLLAASQVFPIFMVIAAGIILGRRKFLDEHFIRTSSRLVFHLALPVMVFQKIAAIPPISPEIAYGSLLFILVTLAFVFILWLLLLRLPRPAAASTVQGAFRSNIAIIGLAILDISRGPTAAALGAVSLALIMPLYNVLAVVILSSAGREKPGLSSVLAQIFRNPLIWSVLLALPFAMTELDMPAVLDTGLEYFSRLSLPLALLAIGAGLRLSGLKRRAGLWFLAVSVKLIILPALLFWVLLKAGISGDLLAALIISAACPTAVASYAMADAMGADADLAGEIVSMSTLLSIFSLTIWLWILQGY